MPSAASVLRISAAVLLAAFLLAPQSFAPIFAPLNHNGAPAIYDQGNLLSLALAHLGTVLLAAAASTIVAVGLGILVTRKSGAEFLPLSRTLVNIGQTFPPVAVLAVAVPLIGFGEAPTLIALFAYGLLPIFENTIAGLQTCPPAIIDAANGMGMSARERLASVELPLAMPLILEGVRLSLVINVGTATLGSTVAAKGLGEVIIAGLLQDVGPAVADSADQAWGHRQVVERASGLVVGGIGFFGPPHGGEVEIGYGIVPSRQGSGYATEALRAMIAMAWADSRVLTVAAGTDPGNAASQRVLAKAGFRQISAAGEFRYRLTRAD